MNVCGSHTHTLTATPARISGLRHARYGLAQTVAMKPRQTRNRRRYVNTVIVHDGIAGTNTKGNIMKILIACEFSGIVRDAFIAKGHDAVSCDLLPTERPGPHIQDDVLKHLDDGWDMMIAHPPCTYLSSMSIWWNHKRPERWALTYDGMDFVKKLWMKDIQKVVIENPIGFLNRNWKKPTQIIHPWQFGQEFSKPTCLWIKGLPSLVPTKIVGKGEFYIKANGSRMAKWSHKISGSNKERAKNASRTFQGIANAMAELWGTL